MISKGEERVFVPELPYTKRYSYKLVKVVEVGVMISLVVTEQGVRFAAFNSELRRAPSREDSTEW